MDSEVGQVSGRWTTFELDPLLWKFMFVATAATVTGLFRSGSVPMLLHLSRDSRENRKRHGVENAKENAKSSS
jgi:hypothetical protein